MTSGPVIMTTWSFMIVVQWLLERETREMMTGRFIVQQADIA